MSGANFGLNGQPRRECLRPPLFRCRTSRRYRCAGSRCRVSSLPLGGVLWLDLEHTKAQLRNGVPVVESDVRRLSHRRTGCALDTETGREPLLGSPPVSVIGRWSCRESNPGPSPFQQGFSVCSSLSLYSDLPVTRTSRDDDPSRCLMSHCGPRPSATVSSLNDAGTRGESSPGPTDQPSLRQRGRSRADSYRRLIGCYDAYGGL